MASGEFQFRVKLVRAADAHKSVTANWKQLVGGGNKVNIIM